MDGIAGGRRTEVMGIDLELGRVSITDHEGRYHGGNRAVGASLIVNII